MSRDRQKVMGYGHRETVMGYGHRETAVIWALACICAKTNQCYHFFKPLFHVSETGIIVSKSLSRIGIWV